MPRPENLNGLGFKFQLGDILIHKGAAHHFKPPFVEEIASSGSTENEMVAIARDIERYAASINSPRQSRIARFVVLARSATEYPHGVRHTYSGSWCNGETGICSEDFTVSEDEVVLLPRQAGPPAPAGDALPKGDAAG